MSDCWCIKSLRSVGSYSLWDIGIEYLHAITIKKFVDAHEVASYIDSIKITYRVVVIKCHATLSKTIWYILLVYNKRLSETKMYWSENKSQPGDIFQHNFYEVALVASMSWLTPTISQGQRSRQTRTSSRSQLIQNMTEKSICWIKVMA